MDKAFTCIISDLQPQLCPSVVGRKLWVLQVEGPLWVVGSTGLVLKTVTWRDSGARMLVTQWVAVESVEDE